MHGQKLRILDVLAKKRDGATLTEDEIQIFVQGVTDRTIQDVQIGAMLMAIYLKGMTDLETATLTKAMLHSGRIFQWPTEIRHLIVDKHSTGGVGDKISLILAPALAACGLKVPMISGRGLGFTGGTIDKLESIPGFRVNLSDEETTNAINDVGCFIMAQTDHIAPADKVLYACRDVTATVDCIPLIAASILSKKASENLSALLLDLKCGSAAFIKDQKVATEFAHLLVRVGKELGLKTAVVITSMDSPLGLKIGNALEVEESIDTLKGQGPRDIEDLVTLQGGILLHISGLVGSSKEGEDKIRSSLRDGSALLKFRDMMVAQGVSLDVASTLCSGSGGYSAILPEAKYRTDLQYDAQTGQTDDHVTNHVHSINALELALVSGELGASRAKLGGPINPAVGIQVLAPPGGSIKPGQPWLRVYHDEPQLSECHIIRLQAALVVRKLEPGVKNEGDVSRVLQIIY